MSLNQKKQQLIRYLHWCNQDWKSVELMQTSFGDWDMSQRGGGGLREWGRVNQLKPVVTLKSISIYWICQVARVSHTRTRPYYIRRRRRMDLDKTGKARPKREKHRLVRIINQCGNLYDWIIAYHKIRQHLNLWPLPFVFTSWIFNVHQALATDERTFSHSHAQIFVSNKYWPEMNCSHLTVFRQFNQISELDCLQKGNCSRKDEFPFRQWQ